MSTDLRAQVLDASVELIAEQGIAGLSMREVARRAGVSHQAPYHYFTDKAAIVAALVERGFTMLAERLEAAAANGPSERALDRAGRAYVRFALDEPAYFRLLFRPELTGASARSSEAGERAFAVLRQLVDERLGKGARAAKRDAVVSLHWSMVHGLSTLLIDGPLSRKFDDAASRERHVDLVLRVFAELAPS